MAVKWSKHINILNRRSGETFDPPIMLQSYCMYLHYFHKKGEALQKICNALPIRRDNAFLATGNGNNKFYRETTHSNCI
jgi:hypothetical protein